MVGKGEKSGKRGGPGNLGARVMKKEGGKGGKLLLADRKYRVVGGGEAVLGSCEGDWKVYKGLKRVDGGWENDEVRLEDKMVLDGSEWGISGRGDWDIWEDGMEGVEEEGKSSAEAVEEIIERMRGEKDGVEIKKEKVEEGKGNGEEERGESKRGEKNRREEKDECCGGNKKSKGKEVKGVVVEEEEEEGLSSMEKWALEKKVKERREREERKKREKEGVINRGKDRGMGRDSVLEMWKEWQDYEELVKDARYILGVRTEEARSFMLDREIRKVLEISLGGEMGKGGMRRVEREEVTVRSEVVVESGLKEKESLKKEVAVEGGRSYSEVLRGTPEGEEEMEELAEKKDIEVKKWLDDSLERERRSGKVVEVVMDSQSGKSEEEWKVDEVMDKLGVSKNAVDKMKVCGNRVKMVMKDREVAEKIEELGKEVIGEAIGGGVVEVKRNENWVGMVVPGMEVDMWEGKMEELKKKIEEENGIKLMRVPRWLANEDRRRANRLKRVGVIIHVARESIRVKLSEEGLKWKGKCWEEMLKVNRYDAMVELGLAEEMVDVFCFQEVAVSKEEVIYGLDGYEVLGGVESYVKREKGSVVGMLVSGVWSGKYVVLERKQDKIGIRLEISRRKKVDIWNVYVGAGKHRSYVWPEGGRDTVVVGDFNAWSKRWEGEEETNMVEGEIVSRWADEWGLKLGNKVGLITRVDEREGVRGRVLDLAFGGGNVELEVEIGEGVVGLDHKPLMVKVSVEGCEVDREMELRKEVDWVKLEAELKVWKGNGIVWKEGDWDREELDRVVEELEDGIGKRMEECRGRRKWKGGRKRWWNEELEVKRLEVRELEKDWEKRKGKGRKELCVKERKVYRRMVAERKGEYWMKYLEGLELLDSFGFVKTDRDFLTDVPGIRREDGSLEEKDEGKGREIIRGLGKREELEQDVTHMRIARQYY
ncbi:hypothetical protein B9Z19DRAFT_1128955 [Tuber borchii]|uniref:Uncharacterized protein n=1 Tax=Tuber borchii TaxID=42251 RepID=A0A2T6ZNA1_TUBBO|nr:hypothetical protein B9Z19DRAFT_1128955 [Tuber borchii]